MLWTYGSSTALETHLAILSRHLTPTSACTTPAGSTPLSVATIAAATATLHTVNVIGINAMPATPASANLVLSLRIWDCHLQGGAGGLVSH